MPKPKIIDEYTDRTDLSAFKKWSLRHPGMATQRTREWREKHPERYRAIGLKSQIKWREAHPDKYRELMEKNNRKAVGKKKLKSRIKQFKSIETRNDTVSVARRAEILRLHFRGKTVADIVVGLGIPSSIVINVLRRSQNIPVDGLEK